MNENERLILAHTQYVAARFFAWRGALNDLVLFVGHSMAGVVAQHDIERHLRKAEFQNELAGNWETALWRASDKSWRLVTLAINPDADVARQRLNEFPASSSQCRWCLQDEHGLAEYDLKAELNLRREVVPNSRLHPQCMRPWGQLRALAERE